MKVGFTGTRRGFTQPQKAEFYLVLHRLHPIAEFHHGDCEGCDAQAHARVRPFTDIKIVIHPGYDIDGRYPHRANCVADEKRSPKPYIERNHNIVNESELMIAMPAEAEEVLRSGTWATIRYARKQNKPLLIIWPDGSVLKERIDD